MKTIAAILVVVFLGACAVFAAEQPKVSIEARNTPIKDLVSVLTQQTGAAIVLDPKVQASVSLSLKDAELSQALDAVAKLNKLVWKKLQFAKPNDDTVKLDQIKSAMVALASMPMEGLSVEDPAAKTTAVFAKDLPSSPDVAAVKLPEGYSWMTVYVILASEPKEEKASSTDNTVALSAEGKDRALQMAKMTPEERRKAFAEEMAAQMSLAPEVRRQIMADRLMATFGMDPQYRDQYREDMHQAFHLMRDQNPGLDFGRGGPGGSRRGRDRGNNSN
jgi:hypothetical protein